MHQNFDPKEKAGSASALLFQFVSFLFLFGLRFLDFVVCSAFSEHRARQNLSTSMTYCYTICKYFLSTKLIHLTSVIHS